RELEVAMLLLQGMRQEDIARRLSLSSKTVNTHKSRLFAKLQIEDGMSLARMAQQYGLTDPGQAGCGSGARSVRVLRRVPGNPLQLLLIGNTGGDARVQASRVQSCIPRKGEEPKKPRPPGGRARLR